MKLVPGDCGIQYLQSIVNVLSAIQTFVLSYEIVFPKKRHKAVSKDSGKTNYIERFNNTMRQRISRLVRKTLSFSKKLSNHLGAIWYFIHEYNASLSIEQKLDYHYYAGLPKNQMDYTDDYRLTSSEKYL
jgi:hypothetical protein